MANPKKAQEIISIKGPIKETDEYGFKRMLKKLNEWARCPECGDFLVKKDENTFKCRKCGFEKPAAPPPELDEND